MLRLAASCASKLTYMAAFILAALPQLQSPRFLLRGIVSDDRPAVFRGLSDPRVIANYGVSYSSLEATQRQMDWFQEIHAVGIGICHSAENPELLGATGLNDIHAGHRRGEIGYWLMPEHRGQGIGRECVATLLAFAFGTLGLHRIGAEVDIDNPRSSRSSRLLEQLGFQFEGIRRGYEFKAGKALDLRCCSRLATDPEVRGP